MNGLLPAPLDACHGRRPMIQEKHLLCKNTKQVSYLILIPKGGTLCGGAALLLLVIGVFSWRLQQRNLPEGA